MSATPAQEPENISDPDGHWDPMSQSCPDCKAEPGQDCHWDCSSNWTTVEEDDRRR